MSEEAVWYTAMIESPQEKLNHFSIYQGGLIYFTLDLMFKAILTLTMVLSWEKFIIKEYGFLIKQVVGNNCLTHNRGVN